MDALAASSRTEKQVIAGRWNEPHLNLVQLPSRTSEFAVCSSEQRASCCFHREFDKTADLCNN
jgi:hypothetical protein